MLSLAVLMALLWTDGISEHSKAVKANTFFLKLKKERKKRWQKEAPLLLSLSFFSMRNSSPIEINTRHWQGWLHQLIFLLAWIDPLYHIERCKFHSMIILKRRLYSFLLLGSLVDSQQIKDSVEKLSHTTRTPLLLRRSERRTKLSFWKCSVNSELHFLSPLFAHHVLAMLAFPSWEDCAFQALGRGDGTLMTPLQKAGNLLSSCNYLNMQTAFWKEGQF